MIELLVCKMARVDWLLVDSTVTDRNIAASRDDQLLAHDVRVLSRLMCQSKDTTV